MYWVIDVIWISNALRARYPEYAEKYASEGVLAILDPSQTHDIAPPAWQPATIRSPDGTTRQAHIDAAEVHHGVLGLFFRGLEPEDVPRGSRIEWTESAG